MIEENIIKGISGVLARYEKKILFAYLFGSAARPEVSPGSDVDIAVFMAEQPDRSFFDLKLSLFADLCRALKRNDLDLVILNTATNLILLDEIVRTGVVLYDTDPDARAHFELTTLHRALDFKSHRLAVMGV